MSTPTSPQTFLEAINELLQAVRVAPIMDVNDSLVNEDVAGAVQALNMAAREIQRKGWEWNTEYNFKLVPDVPNREVWLPGNCLKVRSIRSVPLGQRLVQRGQRLYSPDTSSYSLPADVSEAYVEMVVALEYEELPENFKAYVVAVAARKFCLPKLPDGATFRYTEEYVENARLECIQEDALSTDSDLAATSPHFAAMRLR